MGAAVVQRHRSWYTVIAGRIQHKVACRLCMYSCSLSFVLLGLASFDDPSSSTGTNARPFVSLQRYKLAGF